MKWRAEQVGRASWSALLFLVKCCCLVIVLASTALGCISPLESCNEGDTCAEEVEDPPLAIQCDLHAFHGSPVGQCVPYVEATWDMALVRMAHIPKHQLHCPDSAPFSGFSGVELPERNAAPRNVIACTVNPLATCPSLAFACVPFEEDYPACVVQSGSLACPPEYDHIETTVDAEGDTKTVCCREPQQLKSNSSH